MTDIDAIAKRYRILCPAMDERLRRLWVGAECSVLGFGGITTLSKATGLSRNTIARGIRELKTVAYREDKRVRRGGGGRKRAMITGSVLILLFMDLNSNTELITIHK